MRAGKWLYEKSEDDDDDEEKSDGSKPVSISAGQTSVIKMF